MSTAKDLSSKGNAEMESVKSLLKKRTDLMVQFDDLEKRLESQKTELAERKSSTDPDNESAVEAIVQLSVQSELIVNKLNAMAKELMELDEDLKGAVRVSENIRCQEARTLGNSIRERVGRIMAALFPPHVVNGRDFKSMINQTSLLIASSNLEKFTSGIEYRTPSDFARAHLKKCEELVSFNEGLDAEFQKIITTLRQERSDSICHGLRTTTMNEG